MAGMPPEKKVAEQGGEAILPPEHASGHIWNHVREHYEHQTALEMADRLGVERDAVVEACTAMGLTRPWCWCEESPCDCGREVIAEDAWRQSRAYRKWREDAT